MLSAVIPIPVTVKIDNLRVIRRDELEEKEKEDKEAQEREDF